MVDHLAKFVAFVNAGSFFFFLVQTTRLSSMSLCILNYRTLLTGSSSACEIGGSTVASRISYHAKFVAFVDAGSISFFSSR